MPFLLSSRFDSKEASQAPYDTIQAIVREKDVDFSAFRLLQNWPESMSKAPPSNKRWYVVALGYPPPEPFLTQVKEAINMGEPTAIPDEAVAELARRRLRETANQATIHREMSRSVFSERFSRLVGMSPMQYVTRWRMSLARSWICEEHTSASEAAHRLGYSSEAAFSRAFKRYLQMPPGAFRRDR